MNSRLELFSEPDHILPGRHDTWQFSTNFCRDPSRNHPRGLHSAKVVLDDTNGQLKYVIEIPVMLSSP